MANRPFTQAEVELIQAYLGRKPKAWIADQLGRTVHALNAKIRRGLLWPDVRSKRKAMSRRAKIVLPGKRLCRRCGRVLDLVDFYKNSSSPDGLQTRCKRCSVEMATQWNLSHPKAFARSSATSRLRRKYGLERADFDALLQSQNGLCPICGQALQSRIHVDHDHVTGAVRGLLHTQCNAGLGALGDSVETLTRAIAYLQQVH